MANYNLGTARGRIEIDYDGRGTSKAKHALGEVKDESKKTGFTTDQTARGMARGGAVIAAGLAIAVNAAANFEQRLSAIKAVSGATAGEMEKVRAKALQIGKDTAFSATEAASAMEELSKAGISTSDILNGAADATVALAAAGEVDLPFAASVASNAMNQFSLSAQDMPKIADIIAGAANASAIDVKEFGYSLSQVGAVANLAGLDFKDTAVAIAELGNAGIKGSDAGTSLKTMLSNLQPSTKKQRDLMRELGLVTKDGTNQFYDQRGKLKSLRDIQETLGNSLKGMTQQQKQATLETIFGADAIRAAAVLAGNGAAGYDKLAGSIDKIKAADVAKTRLDNMKGSLEQLKGSAETLGIQLGTILIPTVRRIIDALTAATNWFLNLSEGQQKTIVVAAAVIASFLLVGAAIIKIVTFAQRLSGAVRVLYGVMAAHPFVLILAAIALLIAGIVLLWKRSETFRSVVKAVWNAVKSIIGAVVRWFTGTIAPSFMRAVNDVVNVFRAMGRWISSVCGTVKSIVTGTFNAVRGAVVSRVNGVRSAVTAAWDAVSNATRTRWNGVKTAVTAAVNALLTKVRSIRGVVVGALAGAGSWLVNAGRNIIRGLLNGINSMIGAVRSKLGQLTSMIPNWKGPADRDEILLEQNGQLIMEGLLRGLASQVNPLRSFLGGITTEIPETFMTPQMAFKAIPQQRASEDAGSGASVVVNNYNPVAEPSSVTTTKTATRLAQLGVIG